MLALPVLVVDDGDTPAVLHSPTDIWRNPDGTIFAYVHSSNRVHCLDFPDVGKFFFNGDSHTVKAVPARPKELDSVRDTFYRIVLPMRLQLLGQEVLHASAIVMNGTVLALCAASGTGKSTSAYALNRRGYSLWADDAVCFRKHGSIIETVPLPYRLRLRAEAAKLFGTETVADYSKSIYGSFTQNGDKSMPLSHLIILQRLDHSDHNDEVIRLSPKQAFVEVLTHSWCFSLSNKERKRQMMNNYFDLLSRVKVFRIPFRPGLQALNKFIESIENLSQEQ